MTNISAWRTSQHKTYINQNKFSNILSNKSGHHITIVNTAPLLLVLFSLIARGISGSIHSIILTIANRPSTIALHALFAVCANTFITLGRSVNIISDGGTKQLGYCSSWHQRGHPHSPFLPELGDNAYCPDAGVPNLPRQS